MGNIISIILFIIFMVWIKGKESDSLKEKGIKCPYCNGNNVNRTSAVGALNHQQHHKQFKCNNCKAYF